MNIITGLAREHVIFNQLVHKLEQGCKHAEKINKDKIRNALIVLLAALDKHEEIEETVFGYPSYATGEDAKRILGEIEFQHRQIQELRLELLQTLNTAGFPSERMQLLVSQMADKLRLHFKTEEEVLWPHYENFTRSLDAAIRPRLDPDIHGLAKDLETNLAAIKNYLVDPL